MSRRSPAPPPPTLTPPSYSNNTDRGGAKEKWVELKRHQKPLFTHPHNTNKTNGAQRSKTETEKVGERHE